MNKTAKKVTKKLLYMIVGIFGLILIWQLLLMNRVLFYYPNGFKGGSEYWNSHSGNIFLCLSKGKDKLIEETSEVTGDYFCSSCNWFRKVSTRRCDGNGIAVRCTSGNCTYYPVFDLDRWGQVDID